MTAITSLPRRSATLLEKFCTEGNKDAGVADPKTFEIFCKFAAVAHQENVSLTPDMIYEHLVGRGWPVEQADAAAKRYRAASLLLGIYDRVRAGESID